MEKTSDIKNTKWQIVYNNDFLPKYTFFKDLLQKNSLEKIEKLSEEKKHLLCNNYQKLFDAGCTLLYSYLTYNGIYKYGRENVIKEAFYVEVIEDGFRWINLYKEILYYENEGYDTYGKHLIKFINPEYLNLFSELDSYFQKEKAI